MHASPIKRDKPFTGNGPGQTQEKQRRHHISKEKNKTILKLRFTPEKWAYLKPLFVAMTTRLSKKGSLIHDAARDPKQEFRNVASESARRMPTRSEKKFRNVARETAARNPREEFRNVATVVPAIKHAGEYVEKEMLASIEVKSEVRKAEWLTSHDKNIASARPDVSKAHD